MLVRAMGVLVVSALLSGCARVMVHMKETDVVGGPDYVVVKIKSSKDVVYDCVSAPDGEKRDPTCTKVEYRTQDARK